MSLQVLSGKAAHRVKPVIIYRTDKSISLDTFIDVYRRSTLGERRPIHDRTIMAAMLEHADILISAWDGQHLIGLARTLTDYDYVAYLADLAVDAAYQRQGIGKELIRRTPAAVKPTCSITLLAAPKANEYYPHIGFIHHPRAWMLKPKEIKSL
ncbi:MAG: GNAT family N-acetyltransferase [Candidatus Competibacteraceae bacterium]